MSLIENKPMTFAQGKNSIPAGAGVEVFHGAMISVSLGDSYVGKGYGRPLEAGETFVGHAMEYVDNTEGSDGDADIELRDGDSYRLVVPLSGVSQNDVGSYVYASSDETLTLTDSGNTLVGVVIRYRGTDEAEVLFVPFIQ